MGLFRSQGIRIRMALLYLSLFGAGLTVFCFLLFQNFIRSQEESFDKTLFNFGADISNDLQVDLLGRLFLNKSGTSEEGKYLPFPLGKSYLEIRNVEGRVLLYSKSLRGKELPFSEGEGKILLRTKASFQTIMWPKEGGGVKPLRLVRYLARHEGWREPLILQVAVPMDLLQEERAGLMWYFTIAIPLFLLVVGILGVFLSRSALLPVQRISNRVKNMSDLKERIPLPRAKDEISELANTFNRLLDRMESAFVSQDRFIANASHQLKTPLTIIKGELEMVKASKNPKDVENFLESASDEINHMINLVQDLLMLARIESGKDSISFDWVRLDEILLFVVSRMQKLATQKGIILSTTFTSEIPNQELEVDFQGDEELLTSLLENFIENSIKYSPKDSTVEVALKSREESIAVEVTDHGPGISEESRMRLFERFQRGKSGDVQGSGLGLSVAQEIANLHGVKIDLISNDIQHSFGTKVRIVFPRKKTIGS